MNQYRAKDASTVFSTLYAIIGRFFCWIFLQSCG